MASQYKEFKPEFPEFRHIFPSCSKYMYIYKLTVAAVVINSRKRN